MAQLQGRVERVAADKAPLAETAQQLLSSDVAFAAADAAEIIEGNFMATCSRAVMEL